MPDPFNSEWVLMINWTDGQTGHWRDIAQVQFWLTVRWLFFHSSKRLRLAFGNVYPNGEYENVHMWQMWYCKVWRAMHGLSLYGLFSSGFWYFAVICYSAAFLPAFILGRRLFQSVRERHILALPHPFHGALRCTEAGINYPWRIMMSGS